MENARSRRRGTSNACSTCTHRNRDASGQACLVHRRREAHLGDELAQRREQRHREHELEDDVRLTSAVVGEEVARAAPAASEATAVSGSTAPGWVTTARIATSTATATTTRIAIESSVGPRRLAELEPHGAGRSCPSAAARVSPDAPGIDRSPRGAHPLLQPGDRHLVEAVAGGVARVHHDRHRHDARDLLGQALEAPTAASPGRSRTTSGTRPRPSARPRSAGPSVGRPSRRTRHRSRPPPTPAVRASRPRPRGRRTSASPSGPGDDRAPRVRARRRPAPTRPRPSTPGRAGVQRARPPSREVSITIARRRVCSCSNSRTMTAPVRAVEAQCTWRMLSPGRYSRTPRYSGPLAATRRAVGRLVGRSGRLDERERPQATRPWAARGSRPVQGTHRRRSATPNGAGGLHADAVRRVPARAAPRPAWW